VGTVPDSFWQKLTSAPDSLVTHISVVSVEVILQYFYLHCYKGMMWFLVW
jgi:hypothetical protein